MPHSDIDRWNRNEALPDGHRLYSSQRTFDRMDTTSESQTYASRGTPVELNLEERIVIERASPLSGIRRTPATILPRKGRTIAQENDGPSTPQTARRWHKARQKFLNSLPKWEDDIGEVRNWPTATRYIRSGDETRAEALAKYAAANDNLASDPIGDGVSFDALDGMGIERVHKIRPTPNEVSKAGAGGLRFDKANKLIEWKGSDGKFRQPRDQFEAVRQFGKSRESKAEYEFESRQKDQVTLSNRHLSFVLASAGTNFPTVLPASPYRSAGVDRYDAAQTLTPKKLTTTRQGERGHPWSTDEYNAALEAYNGRVTILQGPALPRTKSGGFQDNMPSFVGLRIYGHGGHGDPVKVGWEDKIIKRIDFRNAKKKLGRDNVLYLDLATTDATSTTIGIVAGAKSQRNAERVGPHVVDHALDKFYDLAA